MIKIGLNAYITSDRKHLKKRVKLVAGSTIEKVSKRQKFECPICGQSLTNGEPIELHHSPSLKEWKHNKTSEMTSKNVKLWVTHRMCHRMIHKENLDVL